MARKIHGVSLTAPLNYLTGLGVELLDVETGEVVFSDVTHRPSEIKLPELKYNTSYQLIYSFSTKPNFRERNIW